MPVEIADYTYGRIMYPATDIYLNRFLGKYHQYSEGEALLFRQLLTEGDIVLDIGANVGCHTVAFAKMVGPSGVVFALEPQLKLYYMLCANLALNDLDNVNALNMAASDVAEPMIVPDVDYNLPNNFGGISLRPPGSQGRQVNTICLDSTIGMMLSRLKLLKIDVEGMEARVIRGARELIRKLRPFIYVENDRIENNESLSSLLKSMEYRLFQHFPQYVTSEDVEPELNGMVSLNLLCVPSEMNVVVNDLQEV